MARNLAPGPLRNLPRPVKVGQGQGQAVAAEVAVDGLRQLLGGVVHGEERAVPLHGVDGADEVVVVPTGRRRVVVLLQAQKDAQPPLEVPAQTEDLRAVGGLLRRRHGPAVRVPAGREGAVLGEAQRGAPRRQCPAGHPLRRARPVAEDGVGVEILEDHGVIFSCFTLWSMTWREASSARMSSTEMPISTIKTIT